MALRPTVSRGLPLSVQDTRLLTSTGRRTETPISLSLPRDGGSRKVRRRPRRSAIPDKVNGAPPRRNPSRQPNLPVPPCSSPLRQRDGGAVVHRTAAKAPQGDRVESGHSGEHQPASQPSIHSASSTTRSGGTRCASISRATSSTAGSPESTARCSAGRIWPGSVTRSP